MTAPDPKSVLPAVNQVRGRSLNYLRALFLIALTAAPFSLATANDETAISSWPPEEVAHKAEEKLSARSEALDMLDQKMRSTLYLAVQRVGPSLIEAVPVGASAGQVDYPVDAEEWDSLFVAAGVDVAGRNVEDGVILTRVEDKYELDNRLFRFAFNSSYSRTTPVCAPEYAQYQCGRCIHPQDNQWAIEYTWQPVNPKPWSRQESRDCFEAFTPTR